MSAAGPELPPHLLAKRKRQQEEAQKNNPSTTSGANQDSPKRQRVTGPELPPATSTPAGPSLPPTTSSPSVGPALPPQAARPVAGPAPPPAPLDERPLAPPDSDDDSDDDGFGPSLPTAADLNPPASNVASSQAAAAPVRTQRDEWMTLPPQQDDLAARMDPSKMRARGFNTGKNARGGNTTPAGGNIAAAWTETPEEKLKRLQDEAMGVKPAAAGHVDAKEAARNKEKEAEARRIREQTVDLLPSNTMHIQADIYHRTRPEDHH
jgi:hypothetical protein